MRRPPSVGKKVRKRQELICLTVDLRFDIDKSKLAISEHAVRERLEDMAFGMAADFQDVVYKDDAEIPDNAMFCEVYHRAGRMKIVGGCKL